MAKSINILFRVSCIIKKGPNAGKVHFVERPDLEVAYGYFEDAKKGDFQCLLESIVDDVRIVLDAHNWDFDCYKLLDEKQWQTFSIGFNPTAKSPNTEFMKVRIYVYWPVGVCYFDNVRIEEISKEEMEELVKQRSEQ